MNNKQKPVIFERALQIAQAKQSRMYREGARGCDIGDCGYDGESYFRVSWLDKNGKDGFCDIPYYGRENG